MAKMSNDSNLSGGLLSSMVTLGSFEDIVALLPVPELQ